MFWVARFNSQWCFGTFWARFGEQPGHPDSASIPQTKMTEAHTQRNRRSGTMPKLLPPSNRDKIRFRLYRGDRSEFALIEIDVSKLDSAWRASGEGYIWPDGTGANEGRLEGFATWLTAYPAEPIIAPWVYLDGLERVCFADGRHRFALLRDRGYLAIKIAVRKKQAAEFKKRFRLKQS